MSINSFPVPLLPESSLSLLVSYFGPARIQAGDQSDQRSDRKRAAYDTDLLGPKCNERSDTHSPQPRSGF
jgi:hypothetical protein